MVRGARGRALAATPPRGGRACPPHQEALCPRGRRSCVCQVPPCVLYQGPVGASAQPRGSGCSPRKRPAWTPRSVDTRTGRLTRRGRATRTEHAARFSGQQDKRDTAPTPRSQSERQTGKRAGAAVRGRSCNRTGPGQRVRGSLRGLGLPGWTSRDPTGVACGGQRQARRRRALTCERLWWGAAACGRQPGCTFWP